jgi:hypothetical protein
MACKCKVYQSVDEQNDSKMIECGEPETIPGVCYDHCVLCTICRIEHADPSTRVCLKCRPENGTLLLSNGCTLYWKDNGIGGRIYTSDEVGCGVHVWDTCIVDEDTLLAAIKQEHKMDNIIRVDIDKDFWEAIKKAADESSWIPKDHYFINDWVSDVCRYLREGHPKEEV